MKYSKFVAQTDLEINDLVEYSGSTSRVYDIRTIHTLRQGNVTFEFVLEKDGQLTDWIARESIGKRVI